MKFLATITLLAAWMIAGGPISAQTPKPLGKDALPPPQEIPLVPIVTSIRIIPGPQLGQRNIWELYSVNSRGQFVPRVVADPGGYYYLSDGRPYPWTTFGSRSYMPGSID